MLHYLIVSALASTPPTQLLPQVRDPTAIQRAFMPKALELLSDETPCALFYDLDAFRDTLLKIKAAFPDTTLHAIAMKANPLAACLLLAKDLGFGVEVASPCELEHALRLGFAPERIVMDSPAKTVRDLRNALAAGVQLNADNFDELARIDEILTNEYGGGGAKGLGSCTSRIGVRVNPQYGEGKIAATGTIAKTSKFGLPLMEVREELLDAYKRYAWLTCVHCHVGSQGCELELLVRGSKSVLALANEINAHCGAEQVRTLDIGGGMPADYGSDAPDEGVPERITPARYRAALEAEAPEMFEDGSKFSLVTEFGRAASAKAGYMVSRVEYVKSAGGRRLASVHCGADLFLRTAYQPKNWPHRVSAWSADGVFLPPAEQNEVWDVVGPLCFRGDIVAEGVELPAELGGGCAICVHDAGAYTIAMFSKYNSRQAPPVFGFRAEGAGYAGIEHRAAKPLIIERLSAGESVEQALSLWQVPQ